MDNKKKRKVIISCFLSLICFILINEIETNASTSDKPDDLYSISAAIIDGESGRVLYEKNGYEKRAMASTTKIMTLIVALENGDKDSLVTVSSYAAKMPDVQLGIIEGEQYKLEDLFYSLMLESHNDVAVAIAEHVAGDVQHFAKLMNDKATELGLNSTYFITPNGLDATDDIGKHETTAVDLARIMKYCVMDSTMKDEFIKICQERSYSFSDYSNNRNFTVYNKNAFLDMMDGVIAGKTGFTGDAGYCYVCALTNNNRTYIVALLGCGWPGNKKYKWHDAKELFTYGIDNYVKQNIINEKYHIPDIKIIDGIEGDLISPYIKANEDLLLADEDIVKIDVIVPKEIIAPVNEGDIIGRIDIYVNGEVYKSDNVYSDRTIKKVSYKYYLNMVLNRFCL